MLETLCTKRPPSLGNASWVSSRTLLFSFNKDDSFFTTDEDMFTAKTCKRNLTHVNKRLETRLSEK